MKRLVLLGEGRGDAEALPVLVRKLLSGRGTERPFFVDPNVIRKCSATDMVKWNKGEQKADYAKWRDRVELARRRSNLGGVLAVMDGDMETFPAGSGSPFCPATAAKALTAEAAGIGAGQTFSLVVVFACAEYETWLVAGAESLAGRKLADGRLALSPNVEFPSRDHESRGKRWLQKHCHGYRETRDQSVLTEMLDLAVVRAKNLRSFTRLDHALDQLLQAEAAGSFIATPG